MRTDKKYKNALCKYDYDKKDPLTGKVTKGISFKIQEKVVLGQPFRCKIGFNRIGETFYLDMELYYVGNIREIIQKNDIFTFKLSNGEVITINSQSDFLPVAQAAPNGVYTMYNAKYDIDAVSLRKIVEFSPTFFRINLESRVYDKELDSKTKNNFTNAAKCILQ